LKFLNPKHETQNFKSKIPNLNSLQEGRRPHQSCPARHGVVFQISNYKF
jgi:hypothetical protein